MLQLHCNIRAISCYRKFNASCVMPPLFTVAHYHNHKQLVKVSPRGKQQIHWGTQARDSCDKGNFFAFLFLYLIHNRYGVGNNVWKFQLAMTIIEPVARIWSSCIISIMMTHRFYNLNNNLIISWWTCGK